MIFTQIIKSILKKTKTITVNMDSAKKDIILSRTGRIVALVIYTLLYIIDILFIKKDTLVVDVALFTSLLSGSTLTLCISKGFYTGLRQMSKKNDVFEKLEVAEKTIYKLQKEINGFNFENVEINDEQDVTTVEVEQELVTEVHEQTPQKNKWIIKGE